MTQHSASACPSKLDCVSASLELKPLHHPTRDFPNVAKITAAAEDFTASAAGFRDCVQNQFIQLQQATPRL